MPKQAYWLPRRPSAPDIVAVFNDRHAAIVAVSRRSDAARLTIRTIPLTPEHSVTIVRLPEAA